MRIGLTYDLRADYLAAGYSLEQTAEFDSPETIEAIEAVLQARGHQTERIGNLPQLVQALAGGRRWDLVFNLAEGLHGIAREAQVPALLEAYGIACTFSDAAVMALALHKGLTKRVLRDGGVLTPDFAVITDLAALDGLTLPYPLFAKPVAEGTSKGVDLHSRINDARQLRRSCARLLKKFGQPVLVETYLPGREFTVGLLGSGGQARVLACMEILLGAEAEPGIYSYDNKAQYEDRVRYQLLAASPLQAAVEQVALAAWRLLDGRDAGRVDVRLDALGLPHFIEVNPLAGLNPRHSDLPIMCRLLGLPYRLLIESILDSASARVIQPARRRRMTSA